MPFAGLSIMLTSRFQSSKVARSSILVRAFDKGFVTAYVQIRNPPRFRHIHQFSSVKGLWGLDELPVEPWKYEKCLEDDAVRRVAEGSKLPDDPTAKQTIEIIAQAAAWLCVYPVANPSIGPRCVKTCGALPGDVV